MKICTLTCHDVYNHGASLQAYALSAYLKKLGHEVKIIDYKPSYLNGKFSFTTVSNIKYEIPIIKQLYQLCKFPQRLFALKRKIAFDNFTKKYLPLTSRYKNYKELCEALPQADLYIAGSDQIWNPLSNCGKDPAFFLNFAPIGTKRASYAASFSCKEFPQEINSNIIHWLNKIDNISVREISGINILKSLGINRGIVVLDPVFLLSKEEWLRILDEGKKNVNPYLFIYDFDNNPELNEFAKSVAKKHGLKIYSLFNKNFANKCFPYIGPTKFVELIKNASCVVSNSYHATIFSIIFHCNFYLFRRKQNLNGRLEDLINLFLLNDRIINFSSNEIKEIDINWNRVDSILENELSKSREYIRKITC